MSHLETLKLRLRFEVWGLVHVRALVDFRALVRALVHALAIRIIGIHGGKSKRLYSTMLVEAVKDCISRKPAGNEGGALKVVMVFWERVRNGRDGGRKRVQKREKKTRGLSRALSSPPGLKHLGGRNGRDEAELELRRPSRVECMPSTSTYPITGATGTCPSVIVPDDRPPCLGAGA